MSTKKTVAVHPPKSKLAKFSGVLNVILKLIGVLMSIFKIVNKAWELYQKFKDWLS